MSESKYETKLSEVLNVTISVTPDLKHCGSSCMFLAYGHDELDEAEVICTCKAFRPDDWQSHNEAIEEGRHRMRDVACIAMFGPNKSYAEINGDWRYGTSAVDGPGSETNGVDPVTAYLRTPKLRVDTDKDQLTLPLQLPTVIPKTVYDEADEAGAASEPESTLFVDEEDRESDDSDNDSSETGEADPMSKPVPCHGKGWSWYGQNNTYPKYGTVIDAYGYFFNRDYREVSLKVIEQVVVTEIDHEAAKAAGIDPKHGFGRPIADPDGCVEIVAYRISVRRGRKPVSK